MWLDKIEGYLHLIIWLCWPKKCTDVSVTEELFALLQFWCFLLCYKYLMMFSVFFHFEDSFLFGIEKVNSTKSWKVDSRGLGWHEVGIDPNCIWASQIYPQIQMMTRFSTLGACETICAGPYLGEYSHSELSLKKRVSI